MLPACSDSSPKSYQVAERLLVLAKAQLEAIPHLVIELWPDVSRKQSTGTKAHLVKLSGDAAALAAADTILRPGDAEPLNLNKGHLHDLPVTFSVVDSKYRTMDTRSEQQHVEVQAVPHKYGWNVTCQGNEHKMEADLCANDVHEIWDLEQQTVHLCRFFPEEVAQKVLRIYSTHSRTAPKGTVHKKYFDDYFSDMASLLFEIKDVPVLSPEELAILTQEELDKHQAAMKDKEEKEELKAHFLTELDQYWSQVSNVTVRANHPVPLHEAVKYFSAVGMSPHSQQFARLLGCAPEPEMDLYLEDDEGDVWSIEGLRPRDVNDVGVAELAKSCRSLPPDDEQPELAKSVRSVRVPLSPLRVPGQNQMVEPTVPREREVKVAKPQLPQRLQHSISLLTDGMASLHRDAGQFPRMASPPQHSPFAGNGAAQTGLRVLSPAPHAGPFQAVASTRAPGVITYIFR